MMSMVTRVVLPLSFVPTPAKNITDAMITVTRMKLSPVRFASAAVRRREHPARRDSGGRTSF